MSEQANPRVLSILRDALNAQIEQDDPPETALTLARLQLEGIPEDEAWRWLAAALLQEMNAMVRDDRQFDRAGYVTALNHLPRLDER